MLVLDDEPQRGVEFFRPAQTRGRPADARVEHLALVDAERVEQFPFRGEPAVQRRTGDPGLQRYFREAQFRLTTATEHIRCGDQDPVPRRRVFGEVGGVAPGS